MTTGGTVAIIFIICIFLLTATGGGLWYFNALCDSIGIGKKCPSPTPGPQPPGPQPPGPQPPGPQPPGPQPPPPGPQPPPPGPQPPPPSPQPPVSPDCTVSGWSDWSACSLTCGGGTQTRTRTVTKQPTAGGQSCPSLTDTQSCNTQGCPVDCVGSWVGCSVTCGTGVDTYRVTRAAQNGGQACPTTDGTTRPCTMPPCGVNCVGGWSGATASNPDGWGACSATCGTGTQTRTYAVTTPSAGGGAQCPYNNGYTETRACPGLQPCAQPVDCVGNWSNWTGCSAGCGGGTQTRTYTVTTAAANGGKACPNKTGDIQTQPCNTTSCCTSATLGDWADVAGPDGKVAPPFNCDGSSGDGRPYVLQTRPITFPANANGPANATDCNIVVNRYRYTAIGCANRNPTGGSCSDSSVPWSATSGCSVTPATANPTGGTCNPSTNPWSLNGCTASPATVKATSGTCSIQGISWDVNNGCSISPAQVAPSQIYCDAGVWNGSTCWQPTANPTGGSCSIQGASWDINSGRCTITPAQVAPSQVSCDSGTWNGTTCAQQPTVNPTGGTCGSGAYNASNPGNPCQSTSGGSVPITNYTCSSTRPGAGSSGDGKRLDPSRGVNSCIFLNTKTNSWSYSDAYMNSATCPAGYYWAGPTIHAFDNTARTCLPNQSAVTSITCPTGYAPSSDLKTCNAVGGNVTGITCPSAYDPDVANKVCNAKPVSVSSITCPTGYSPSSDNTTCVPAQGHVTGITCPPTYNADVANRVCNAKPVSVSSLTCPAGYTQDTAYNQCTAVPGTVSSVSGCPVSYNADPTHNTCSAKAATISSLTCSNTPYFTGNYQTNKCVASS